MCDHSGSFVLFAVVQTTFKSDLISTTQAILNRIILLYTLLVHKT